MATSAPPVGPRTFTIGQRLLRGYGPLAVFAVLVLLMALLVPSKNVKATNVNSGSGDNSLAPAGDQPTEDTSVVDGTPGQAGTAGAAGTSGSKSTSPAVKNPCSDRKDQVPGDPYSPPCIAFSGSNGGGTSKGINATEIHVAYRVLNEKGFQQTLAALAGA